MNASRLAKIMEELGHVGLTEYPSPKVAGAASALLQAYAEAAKVKQEQTAVAPPAFEDVLPAAGRGGFDMRGERF